MSVEQYGERSPSPETNHVNTSIKSVKFAPLESTRISEVKFTRDSDDNDDICFREPLEKPQESVRLCDLEDIVSDVAIKNSSQPR
jgi:hypothetical protein